MLKVNDWNWTDLPEVTSTNDEALILSHQEKEGKYVVSAEMQNAGRGRRGRSWLGIKGNLFMSLLLQCPLEKLGDVVFIISLSLFDALKKMFPQIPLQLKWPNDILLNGHKISGILLEKGENDYLIIGIGVNVKAAPKSENLLYTVDSLADCGFITDRISLLKAYLQAFDENLALWNEQGFEVIRKRWLENAKGLNAPIEVHGVKENKNGIFRDIDETGALVLETADGVEKIYAGDIFYL